METKLIFAKVQRALRSIFHGGRSDNPRSTRRTRIFLVATLEILEEIFYEMLLRKKSIIGSLEFKRNLNGYFGVARAQEILEEIFVEMLLRKKSIIGSSEFKRMLNGCFLVARAQEILEEIFN